MMATPWQADFYECSDFWWPSHRPDNVVTEETWNKVNSKDLTLTQKEEILQRTRASWTRGLRENPADDTIPRWGDHDMVLHWSQLGFVFPKTDRTGNIFGLVEVQKPANLWVPIMRRTSCKKQLKTLLPTALGLEMTTIPIYLTAMWSIRVDTFPLCNSMPQLYDYVNIPEKQKLAMDAYNLLHRVVIEEMLHATLVANVLSLFDYPVNFCQNINYPNAFPLDLPLHVTLEAFTPELLDKFISIERPQGIKPVHNVDYAKSIGEFYDAITEALLEFEKQGYVPKTRDQKTTSWAFPPNGYYAPGALQGSQGVNEMDTIEDALTAVALITAQGEGERERKSSEPHILSHFQLFNLIKDTLPLWIDLVPPLDAYPPEPENKPDERTRDTIVLFNGCYYLMLRILNNIHVTKDKEAQLLMVRSQFFTVMKNLLTPLAYIIMDGGHVPSFQIAGWMETHPSHRSDGTVETNLDPLKIILADKAVGLTLRIDNDTKVGDIYRKIQAILHGLIGH